MPDGLAQRNDFSKEEGQFRPFVLKRLTDYEPSEKTERERSFAGDRQLKEDIFENLDMLFNSRAHASLRDLKGYEDVEDSVLGYGISDFCGRQTSTASREELRAHIFKRIGFFEPRLEPASINIELLDSSGKDASSIVFRIGGIIKTNEVNEEMSFIARLDLESGSAELSMEN